jgi:hypothetical protein
MNRAPLLAMGLLALAWTAADASEITTKDGRVLVGEIRVADEAVVIIDTVLNGVRANVSLQREEIEKLVEGPVPSGFFAPRPADARESKPGDAQPGDNLYLEVPLRGQMGVDVFAKALQRVLTYATRHRVPHLVLRVDLDGFSGSRETRKVFKLLDRYRDRVQLHAIVESGLGDAIAVLLNCHTIHVLPQARIGGATLKIPAGEDRGEFEVRRWGLAREVGRVGANRGRSSVLLQAMIVPALEVSVYLDAAGERRIVRGAPPSGLEPDRLIVHDGPGSVLVLSPEQLQALGVPRLETGQAKALGGALGLEGWKPESAYGTKQMAKVARAEQKASQDKQAKFERDCERVLTRRASVQREIQHSVQQAAKWDPSGADYTTYQRPGYWDWAGNWGTPPVDTGQLTKEGDQGHEGPRAEGQEAGARSALQARSARADAEGPEHQIQEPLRQPQPEGALGLRYARENLRLPCPELPPPVRLRQRPQSDGPWLGLGVPGGARLRRQGP